MEFHPESSNRRDSLKTRSDQNVLAQSRVLNDSYASDFNYLQNAKAPGFPPKSSRLKCTSSTSGATAERPTKAGGQHQTFKQHNRTEVAPNQPPTSGQSCQHECVIIQKALRGDGGSVAASFRSDSVFSLLTEALATPTPDGGIGPPL